MGATGRPRNSIASILAKHVRKAENGCWEWTGGVDRGGYGKTRVGYEYVRAHRYAYSELVAPIPDKMLVLHSCDNRRCLNPAHLFLGSAKDNLRDCVSKGRHYKGGGRKRLTPDLVKQIRKMRDEGLKVTRIAILLGLNNWTVKEVAEGNTWRKEGKT